MSIVCPDDTHGWSKIYLEFYHGVVSISNKGCHIRKYDIFDIYIQYNITDLYKKGIMWFLFSMEIKPNRSCNTIVCIECERKFIGNPCKSRVKKHYFNNEILILVLFVTTNQKLSNILCGTVILIRNCPTSYVEL